MRLPNLWAYGTNSSNVMPATGTKGHTSVAPMRGCSPLWLRMSISSAAFLTNRKAASITASGSPTKVITVRLVVAPGSTSNRRTPSTVSATRAMASILALSRPSEMLGTHSISGRAMSGNFAAEITHPPNTQRRSKAAVHNAMFTAWLLLRKSLPINADFGTIRKVRLAGRERLFLVLVKKRALRRPVFFMP